MQETTCNVGDAGSTPGAGRSPGEENGYPLQYSCLGNPMDEEPGRPQFLGSQRVRHNWATEHIHGQTYRLSAFVINYVHKKNKLQKIKK